MGYWPIVDVLDAGNVFGDFLEEAFNDGGGGFVGVDEDGEVLLMGGWCVLAGPSSSLKGDG